MLIKCQTKLLIKNLLLISRFYGKKSATSSTMQRIHQETLRYVDPYAHIKVLSDVNIKIKVADLHDYPDGNAFIAELHGGGVNNTTTSMLINVSADDKNVEVLLKNLVPHSDFHCELAVPVKAVLTVQCKRGVKIEQTYGKELNVLAEDSIKTQEIRSERIILESKGGHITCSGLLLGKRTNIQTKTDGNIALDKIQGDQFICKTINGNISTNCSYVESSKFETDTGCLHLKNIHKKTEVLIHKQGQLNMTGFHGNIQIRSKGGSMNLQLSELSGDNSIQTENLQSARVNISDNIEHNVHMDVQAVGGNSLIYLDNSLNHLADGLKENKQNFCISGEQPLGKLSIFCNHSVTLGKSSWLDAMKENILTSSASTSPVQ